MHIAKTCKSTSEQLHFAYSSQAWPPDASSFLVIWVLYASTAQHLAAPTRHRGREAQNSNSGDAR